MGERLIPNRARATPGSNADGPARSRRRYTRSGTGLSAGLILTLVAPTLLPAQDDDAENLVSFNPFGLSGGANYYFDDALTGFFVGGGPHLAYTAIGDDDVSRFRERCGVCTRTSGTAGSGATLRSGRWSGSSIHGQPLISGMSTFPMP